MSCGMCPIDGSHCGLRPGLNHHHVTTGEAERDTGRQLQRPSDGGLPPGPLRRGASPHQGPQMHPQDLSKELRLAKHLHQELDQNAI